MIPKETDYATFSFADNEGNEIVLFVYPSDIYEWELGSAHIVGDKIVKYTKEEIAQYVAKREEEDKDYVARTLVEEALEKDDFQQWLIDRYYED